MKNIWAPWRMEYIAGEKDARENKCFLCIEPATDETSLVLARKQTAFVVMNRYPYANGHVMVVPVRHVGKIDELSDGELLDMMGLVRVLSSLLRETIHAEGLNIGINMGKAAGAGLEEHLHIHVVPRLVGDTNFMPVLGETKVISEHLYETYRKLKEKVHEKLL
jgi:ATP adenylyltransferase